MLLFNGSYFLLSEKKNPAATSLALPVSFINFSLPRMWLWRCQINDTGVSDARRWDANKVQSLKESKSWKKKTSCHDEGQSDKDSMNNTNNTVQLMLTRMINKIITRKPLPWLKIKRCPCLIEDKMKVSFTFISNKLLFYKVLIILVLLILVFADNFSQALRRNHPDDMRAMRNAWASFKLSLISSCSAQL